MHVFLIIQIKIANRKLKNGHAAFRLGFRKWVNDNFNDIQRYKYTGNAKHPESKLLLLFYTEVPISKSTLNASPAVPQSLPCTFW